MDEFNICSSKTPRFREAVKLRQNGDSDLEKLINSGIGLVCRPSSFRGHFRAVIIFALVRFLALVRRRVEVARCRRRQKCRCLLFLSDILEGLFEGFEFYSTVCPR